MAARSKEMADGCGMNPLQALVAVAEKTGRLLYVLHAKDGHKLWQETRGDVEAEAWWE